MHLKTYLGKLYITETTYGNSNFLIGPFFPQLYYFILLNFNRINYLGKISSRPQKITII